MSNWTPQQESFYSAILNSDANLSLRAFAGTGKTTSMVEGVNRLASVDPTKKILCCAFNKAIADELRERMPPSVTCKTMNALGHGAWLKHIGKRAGVNTRKSRELMKAIGLSYDLFPDFARSIGLIKSAGLAPSNAQGALGPLDEERVNDILENNLIDSGDLSNPGAYIVEAMELSIKWAWEGNFDFDDQLYMTVVYKSQFDRFQVVMVDESQDLSPIQHYMIQRMLDLKVGRLIIVGDPHQAIYAFRGATARSMFLLEEAYDMELLPLSVSFRCPKAVVKEAQRLVGGIEWAENSPDGLVESIDAFSPGIFSRGDVILCRNTRPLVSLCWGLIRDGVGAGIAGRDIGAGLIRIIDMATKAGATTPKSAGEWATSWGSSQAEKLARKFKEAQAAAIMDRCQAVNFIAQRVGGENASATNKDLKKKVEAMFANGNPHVLLSTIHKAKGREWSRVFFLDRHLIPSKWAKSDEDFQQENNIAYVGVTRAKSTLTYIQSGDHNDV